METMLSIHQIGYIGLLLSAAAYFFLKERDMNASFAKKGFFASAIMYVLSLFFDGGGLLYSLLGILTPDIAFLAAVILIFNRFAPRPKALYFLVFAVIAGMKVFVIDNNVQDGVKTFLEPAKQVPLSADAELLVDIKDHKMTKALTPVLEQYDLSLNLAFPNLKHPEYSDLDDYYTINIPDHQLQNLEAIKEALQETGATDWIEENEVLQVKPLDSDEVSRDKKPDYGVNDPAIDKLWGFNQMNMSSLYAYLRGHKIKPTRKAKVAILDTGVESEHEDISSNYFSLDKKSDYDKMGHGTHCAGIAGAVSNNGKGIASFSPTNEFYQITSIKVLSDNGYGTQKGVLDGIIKAGDTKMDVASMSLGGPSNDSRQRAYSEAVKYANKCGTIVVVAAGNSNANAKNYAPANADGVITVSAVDENLNRAKFSNKVNDIKWGVAAPGVNIYSSFPKNDYKILNGTSMATPYVAGLLGMMKAINPNLSTDQAYEILNKTGKDTQQATETGKFIQPSKVVQEMTK